MGDDHMAESSTNAHATEFLFVDTMIPILNPAGVQELIDYGLYGFALSRFAGTWAAIKCVKDNIESTASVDASLGPPEHRHSRLRHAARRAQHPPRDRPARPGGAAARIQARGRGGLHPRQRHQPDRSIPAAASRRSASSPSARAISTCARRSTTSASTRPGPTRSASGCSRSAARGRSTSSTSRTSRAASRLIVVVEEKRSLIEVQVREDLYGTAMQPMVVGKKDERGALAVPGQGRARPQRHRDRARRAHPARRSARRKRSRRASAA